MKNILKSLFDFMGRPENFRTSVLLIIVYALFFTLLGLILAWVVQRLAYKTFRHDNTVYSFDDFCDHTNRQSSLKVRRVGKRKLGIIIILVTIGFASCETLNKSTDQCYPKKTVKVSGPKRTSF